MSERESTVEPQSGDTSRGVDAVDAKGLAQLGLLDQFLGNWWIWSVLVEPLRRTASGAVLELERQNLWHPDGWRHVLVQRRGDRRARVHGNQGVLDQGERTEVQIVEE